MSTINLDGALCVGAHWLFTSTDIRDHDLAKKRCGVCPVIDGCRRLLEQETAAYPWGGTGPVGTWAGQLFGSTRRKGRK